MTEAKKHPIDIDLWRKAKSAPLDERWKWSWKTWGPTLSKLFTENAKIEDLVCPVCGRKEVYAYFLAVSIAAEKSKAKGRRVYIAERWFGCHACMTQVRDQGEVPRWVEEKDITWATEKKKQWAERKLAESVAKIAKDKQDTASSLTDSSEEDEE